MVILAVSQIGSQKASAKKLEDKLLSAVKNIDNRTIRGEFKIWILKNYLAPSLYFQLIVDLISENTLASIQHKLTKFIKRWLNLSQCCTLAAVYHPEVLNLPFLSHCRKQAKLSMVGALEFSSDPTIRECLTLPKDPEF